jgi:hypothetical protein
MTSMRNVAAQLRARAQAVRRQAAAEPVASIRAALLNDADLWERMAAYEENASEHVQLERESARIPDSPEPG